MAPLVRCTHHTEIGWFALMRPPFHGHFRSLVMLALIPIALAGYVYLLAAIAVYLAAGIGTIKCVS